MTDHHYHHHHPPHNHHHHQHNEPPFHSSLNDLTPPPSHHHHQPPPPSHNHHRQHNEPPLHSSLNNLTPLPSHNHNHRHRHRNQQYHSSASVKGCCCCLILLFSFLALLAITVVLVIILAVKPKKPQFDLQQVAIQYINLAAPLPTTASLSLAVRMLFTATNDNKVGIKYGASTFNIMYRGVPLGRGTVPGFYQPAHSVKQVQTTVIVDRVNLMQADAANLVRDATVNDRVGLRIMGDVNAKIRILGLTSPSVQASIDCGIAISPTKQALIYKQCGFDGLKV
ncbi:hypothetical protein L1987_85485 [Smallanthus sonchifolius]|uniref:Uncharacterized protein n=1 Tax=Smallanthus sonchifolius TaxID=185202 RepID=A0ACB8XY92_9ASTR|nr:hypothetical protein L1987_85485 [Smallanthus sonchifolius]